MQMCRAAFLHGPTPKDRDGRHPGQPPPFSLSSRLCSNFLTFRDNVPPKVLEMPSWVSFYLHHPREENVELDRGAMMLPAGQCWVTSQAVTHWQKWAQGRHWPESQPAMIPQCCREMHEMAIFFRIIFFLEPSTYSKKHKVVTIKIRFSSHQSFVIAAILINLRLCLPWTNSLNLHYFHVQPW
jgi:hypothetical protein